MALAGQVAIVTGGTSGIGLAAAEAMSAAGIKLVLTDLHRDHAVRPEVAQNVEQPLVPEDVARIVMFALQQPAQVSIPRLMVLPQGQVIWRAKSSRGKAI